MKELLQRVCGGCTVCCKTHGVAEIGKPRGKWCPHCNIGNGCNMYANRPAGCVSFKCEWLNGLGNFLARPDFTEIVIDHYYSIPIRKSHIEILQIWEANDGAFHQEYADKLIRALLKKEIFLILLYADGKTESFMKGLGSREKRNLSREIEAKIRKHF